GADITASLAIPARSRSGRSLRVGLIERRAQATSEILCAPHSPVMEQHDARLLSRHVLVDGDDLDVRVTEGLEYRLQFALGHGEVAVDHGRFIRAGEGRPGIDAHGAAHLVT